MAYSSPWEAHLPVKHVAQGLVPDPGVHRGARLPRHQVGSVMEKVDVHQVKGAADTEKGDSVTKGQSFRSLGAARTLSLPKLLGGVGPGLARAPGLAGGGATCAPCSCPPQLLPERDMSAQMAGEA